MLNNQRIKELEHFLSELNLKAPRYSMQDEKSHNIFETINEALTHTSVGSEINHERLEFLGDAVLRLAASEFIDERYPTMNVGERSALRAHLVSDSWLTKVGEKIQIKNSLLIGAKAAGDKFANATLEAEATEALIGALFKCFRELEIIKEWLNPYWEKTSIEVLSDPYKQNPKSTLQEWTQGNFNKLPKYKTVERSKQHGDQQRFFCTVHLEEKEIGNGWGGSIQDSEKDAAISALKKIILNPDP